MSDQYVKVQVEQMKSFGEDAEKEGVDTEEQVPGSSPSASVSPDHPTGTDASSTSFPCKQTGKSRSKPGREDKRDTSDVASQGSVVSSEKNLNRLGYERTLQVKGTGKILQRKSEPNGNYVTIHTSKNIEEMRREEGFKLAKKRRPVTVDTSKAKTSLEALKISIKQLKWKEVCYKWTVFLWLLYLCAV